MILQYCLLIFILIQGSVQGAHNKRQVCSDKGVQCSNDCSEFIFCPSGSGEESSLIAQCDTANGESCDAVSLSCSNATSTSCRVQNYPVTCAEVGLIPDLYDCSKFYICLDGGRGEPEQECTCGNGQHFDHMTKTCRGNVFCTEYKSNPCSNDLVGVCGSVPYNDTSYYAYICVGDSRNLYPEVYNCIGDLQTPGCTCDGFRYHHEDIVEAMSSGICRPYNGGTGTTTTDSTTTDSTTTDSTTTDSTTTDSTTTDSTTTEKTTETTTTTQGPPTTIPPGETKPSSCDYIGQLSPAVECHHYWWCNTYLDPIYKKCPIGYHYDKQYVGCVVDINNAC